MMTKVAVANRHRAVYILPPAFGRGQVVGVIRSVRIVALDTGSLSGGRMIAPLGQVRTAVTSKAEFR